MNKKSILVLISSIVIVVSLGIDLVLLVPNEIPGGTGVGSVTSGFVQNFSSTTPGQTIARTNTATSSVKTITTIGLGSTFELSFLRLPTPGKIMLYDANEAASSITSTGATKGNASAGGASYALEGQRIAYDIVAGGVANSDPALLDTGLKALEWGFSQQAADGSFPNERAADTKDAKYQNIHPISFFVETAAHSALLLRSANVDASYTARAKALVPKLHLAATWMNNPSNLSDFFTNGVDTNQLTTVAAALQEVGVLTGDTSLTASAKALVQKILVRETADGTFPEKKGFDASYQMVSLDYLTRYASLVDDPTWKATVVAAIQKGFTKELSVIHPDGTIDTSQNTRTSVCGAVVSGAGPKGRNVDVIPLRLYYFGYFTNQLTSYGAIADKVEQAGQGFDHISTCKADAESPS